MDFKDLIHVSGKSGLYELAGNRNNGIIARSLEDDTTQFFSNRIHQFTPLESIEMYTHDDNMNLKKIMQSAKEKLATNPPVDVNSDAATLKKYFAEVLPNFDEDRVKISDIKKFIKWFAICKDMDLTEKVEPATADSPKEEAE